MLLASGHIVETVRRFGPVEADLATTRVMVIGNILNDLVNRHIKFHTEASKTIVKQNYINENIGYLRYSGIDIRTGQNNCLFDFFQSAIIPTLLFYNIDLQYVINISIECSSCKEISIVSEQTWDYLLVHQTADEATLDNVVQDLFGPTLQKKLCPKCLNNNQHQTSLSIMNCPKDLFIRFDPIVSAGQKRPKLTTHVDFANIISTNITYTRSYSRYTLQSFIVFNGKDDNGHYMTYARHKDDWYCLNDMNVDVVRSSSLFGDQAVSQPVMLAHFTRPSEIDVFSLALWNVFTNFSSLNFTLPPSLSLNDAAIFFSKRHIIENNPLNLLCMKLFECPICKRGTF